MLYTQENATTTLNQLTMSKNGIARLKIMVGATNFVIDSENQSIMFRFKTSKFANHLKVCLNFDDTYTMVFSKIHGYNSKTVGEFSGLFFDQLKETFEQFTKSYLSFR